jgi:hypothetical protein
MTEYPEPSHQVADFRTQFFPAPSPAPSNSPDRTRLVEKPVADTGASLLAGPFLVQCNCACK